MRIIPVHFRKFKPVLFKPIETLKTFDLKLLIKLVQFCKIVLNLIILNQPNRK